MNSQHTLIVIAGPTAIGKTGLAIALAKHYQTEVISADSRQCYQEMSIGTAKPSATEMDGIPHHFINSHSIQENLNAADYEVYALECLEQIFKKNNIAILCGGTGLYIDALLNGIDEMPDTDKAIEKTLQDDFQKYGLTWLQELCAKEDPEFWLVAEQQNPVRLIRALAFLYTNKESITKYRSKKIKERPFRIIRIALDMPREELYERINLRVDMMVRNGLINEIEQLKPFSHLKNLQTVGYKEFFDQPEWETDIKIKQQVLEKIKQHSRNYAKRQLTWFRKDNHYKWFRPSDIQGIVNYVDDIITVK